MYRAGVLFGRFWIHFGGPDGDLEPHLGPFVPNFSTETCTSQARWRIFGVSQLDPRGALGARKARVRAPYSTSLALPFLHFTSCTHFSALHFLHSLFCTRGYLNLELPSALHFLHDTFQHSTSGLHSEDNFPQGVKFLLKISSEDISSEDNFPQIVISLVLNLI